MSRYSYRGSENALKFYVGSGVIMILLILYYGIFGGGGKMTQIIFASSAFWILSIFSLGIGVGVKAKHPRLFTWPEYVLYAEFCLCSMCGLYALAFTTSTDLVRTETWNGKATLADYQEQHTDERQVSDYDSDGKYTGSHTEYYTHFAEYSVESTAGSYSSNSSIYNTYKSRWGNETSRFGTCGSASESFRVYSVKFDGQEKNVVPVALDHSYVNFITASDSIKKLQGLTRGYETFLVDHPRTYGGPYGQTEIDRVVVVGAPVRASWKQAVEIYLDRALVDLGPRKQCNIVIYLVGTSDQAFAHALEEHWKLGEKNDIVVVIGASKFPAVDWAYVIAWTDVEEFKIELRNAVLAMGQESESPEQCGIGSAGVFVQTIRGQIGKLSIKGGYERKPMSDYDYLISEISLPWWASLLIVIFGGGAQFGVACLLIHNDIEA